MTKIEESDFWATIPLMLSNYHVINRNIFACLLESIKEFDGKSLDCTMLASDLGEDKNFLTKSHTMTELQDYLNNYTKYTREDRKGFLLLLKLLSKKNKDYTTVFGIIDFRNTSFRFRFQSEEMDDFELKLVDNQLHLTALTQRLARNETNRWLEYVFKPKFTKWCLTSHKHLQNSIYSIDIKKSLNLIDIEKYNELYKELKQKYQQALLKLWQEAKASTDAVKFIHEDLAMSAYLITMWQNNLIPESSVVFADLGCGNGLLVYILNMEGIKGYGYDVKCRSIWSYYPSAVRHHLHEKAIEPNNLKLPLDVNWLIGNHSDELSAWIPVLAATLHYQTSYFVMPCCAFELSGVKYQRRNSSVSIYKDFCSYIHQISNKCGFHTLTDRLRIPSTKRNVLLGIQRTYDRNEHLEKCSEIFQFLKDEQDLHPNFSNIGEIKLRDKQIPVKNCTQIPKDIIEHLVAGIFHLLLNEDACKESLKETDLWQQGGQLTLAAIAQKFRGTQLNQIKSEFGGLKTLLRNKHEVFEFIDKDIVRIRKPVPLNSIKSMKQHTIHKRQCYFYYNHPQGCPLHADELCIIINDAQILCNRFKPVQNPNIRLAEVIPKLFGRKWKK